MASRLYATLSASTVATKTVAGSFEQIEVINLGSDPIYFTVDGTTPTVQGDDTHVCPGGQWVRVEGPRGSSTAVKLISAGAPDYGVGGVNP